MTAVATASLALLATVAIWTLGEMIGAPVGYAYVADIAPEHMRGRYQGLYGLCWASGTVTAPAIGAYLVAGNATAFWPPAVSSAWPAHSWCWPAGRNLSRSIP